MIFIENPRKGSPGRVGARGGRGAGRVCARNLGGAKYFFPGPKFPPSCGCSPCMWCVPLLDRLEGGKRGAGIGKRRVQMWEEEETVAGGGGGGGGGGCSKRMQ